MAELGTPIVMPVLDTDSWGVTEYLSCINLRIIKNSEGSLGASIRFFNISFSGSLMTVV